MDLSPRFTWRKYQRDVLTRLDAGDIAPPLHLVAPPGSGKTLLGIELARRRGLPTVVLSPTTAVAEQWVEKIALFLPDGTDPAAFATRDPDADVWLVSLTYQMLSTVQDASAVFTEAVATQWVDELVADGVSADASAAAAWIARLAAENPERYREGLRRRSVAARRALLRAQPDEVARFLHPNAVAILDRFVARGVGTVVLDECHHLLDHWALVVRYLIGRIEAQSRAAYVVGLTATPPDADDERSYANYAALLGEVDFDVPVPAVVREGDLAPFRELLYLTEPTGPESAFLGDVDAAFTRAVEPTLVEPEFIAWMHASCVTATGAVDPEAVNALYDDPDVGTAFAWWFRTVDAAHPAAALFPAPPRGWTPTQARVTLLARYARDVLLLDPAAEDRLMALKRALADFGITITDRGVRQGRSAGDLVLALSGAKCVAAETILTAELDALSGKLRAIVVCDYEQHANRLGRTEGLLGDDAGSATRAFRHLAGCAQLATLTPVLMTSSMLQVAGADVAGFVAAVNRTLLETRSETRIGLPQPSAHPWFEVDVIGSRGAELTRAVSMALAAGVTRCLVATRGLIGVGWDCPPVNTLVDLTATASEASSRQLRGRTLRLDPGWPMKVAHNWSVACLDPDRDGGDVDLVRVLRRHSHLFGPDLYADPMLMLDGTSVAPIVAGFRSVTTKPLTEMVQRMVIDPTAIVAGINKTGLRPRSDVIAPHNRIVMRGLDDRRRTRDAWGIGQPFRDQIGRRAVIGVPLAPKWRGRSGLLPLLSVVLAIASLLGYGAVSVVQALVGGGGSPTGLVVPLGGLVVGIMPFVPLIVPVVRALVRGCPPDAIFIDGARALLEAMQDSGAASGSARIAVAQTSVSDIAVNVDIALEGATTAESERFVELLEEAFGPVRKPRFMIRRNDYRLPVYRRRLLNGLVKLLARRWFAATESYVVVPNHFGRRAETAEAFFVSWQRHVGPGVLVEVRGADKADILVTARAATRPVTIGAYQTWE